MAGLLIEKTNKTYVNENVVKKLLQESKTDVVKSKRDISKFVGLKILLENETAQMNHMRKLLKEAVTTSAGVAPLEQYIYPVLVRAYPHQYAHELVSVQPVQSTFAQVRIMKFKVGTGKGRMTEDKYMLPSFTSENVEFSPYYTSNIVDGESASLDVASAGTGQYQLKYPLAGKVNFVITDENGDSVSGSLAVGGSLAGLTIGTYTIDVSLSNDQILSITNNDGVNSHTFALSLTYVTALEGARRSPSMELSLEKIPIEVEVRALHTSATLNALLDLQSHRVDWEAELVEIMSQEIMTEIDRTIVSDILAKTIEAGNFSTFDVSFLPAAWDRPVTEFIKNLLYAIHQANAKIYRRTRRIPGNWIVVGPEIASALESMNLVVIAESGEMRDMYGYGLLPLGVLKGMRNKVFVDPLFPRNYILVGAKGATIYDAGYVYCPYVPVIPILENIRDVEVPNFTFHIGVYQAAGFKMIDSGFYEVIEIKGDISKLYSAYTG